MTSLIAGGDFVAGTLIVYAQPLIISILLSARHPIVDQQLLKRSVITGGDESRGSE
jgi:hypothetical protein